jgi:hypothetical protein
MCLSVINKILWNLVLKGTDSGQKYPDASSFLYIFHINLQWFIFLFWSQFMSDFDIFLIDTSKIENS